jgi:hypothetical protein
VPPQSPRPLTRPAVRTRRKLVTAKAAETGADSGSGELTSTIGLFQLPMIGMAALIPIDLLSEMTIGERDGLRSRTGWLVPSESLGPREMIYSPLCPWRVVTERT